MDWQIHIYSIPVRLENIYYTKSSEGGNLVLFAQMFLGIIWQRNVSTLWKPIFVQQKSDGA